MSNPPLSSVAGWCSAYRESLPALSSPNPDGKELEFLDLYVARYTLLGGDTEGVPSSATTAMQRLAAAYAAIRQRVAAGEQLASVLQSIFADPQSELILAGTAVDDEVAKICS